MDDGLVAAIVGWLEIALIILGIRFYQWTHRKIFSFEGKLSVAFSNQDEAEISYVIHAHAEESPAWVFFLGPPRSQAAIALKWQTLAQYSAHFWAEGFPSWSIASNFRELNKLHTRLITDLKDKSFTVTQVDFTATALVKAAPVPPPPPPPPAPVPPPPVYISEADRTRLAIERKIETATMLSKNFLKTDPHEVNVHGRPLPLLIEEHVEDKISELFDDSDRR
jgi:hypothetical protein